MVRDFAGREGRRLLVCIWLFCLATREREGEGKRHTLFCHFIGWSTTTEVAGIGCEDHDLKMIFAYKSNHVMWPTIGNNRVLPVLLNRMIMRKLILLILNFGVI